MTIRNRQDWEDLGQIDPLWAILSDPERRNGAWQVDAFLETGATELSAVIERAADLGVPIRPSRALDFGCGVGRVTRAMADRFEESVGVDLAESMIALARDLHGSQPGLEFIQNSAADLTILGDRRFNFVYSNLVLQHLPGRGLILGFVREFVRVLEPTGVLVFQVPSSIPLRYRLQPRRRLYGILRAARVPARFLQRRLRLHPISMAAVPESVITDLVQDERARVLAIDRSTIAPFGIESRTYWVVKTMGRS